MMIPFRTYPRVSVLIPCSAYFRLEKSQRRTNLKASFPHILLIYYMLNDVIQFMRSLDLVCHC